MTNDLNDHICFSSTFCRKYFLLHLATSKKSSNFANVIELEKHIEILLLSNDCVIVPDFGGFMAHHADARFDERDNMFIPPLRTIGFNPKLKMNDSLLAQSYVEAYDISYPEALKRIADEVREIKERIDTDGTFELHNIGTLNLNDDGHYEFEPCEAGILTPDLYGLGSFEFKPLALLATENTKSETKANIVDINAPIEEKTEEEERTISIRVSLLRNIAACCIAVIVFLLFPAPLSNTTTTAGRAIDTNLLDKVMPKDITTGTASLKEIDLKKVDNAETNATVAETNAEAEAKAGINAKAEAKTENIAPNKALTNNKLKHETEVAKTAKATPAETSGYVIVIASKVAKKNAETFVGTLHRQGLNEARVATRNNVTRVVYGNYATRQDAYNALNKLNDKEPFVEGWVMKIN